MIARCLLIAGLILFAFDVARLNMTGVAVLGVVLMLVAGALAGMFTPGFWVADDARSAVYEAIDGEIGR